MLQDLKRALKGEAASWPTGLLSLALLAAAAVVVFVALMPGRPLLKAVVLAYVVLP